MRFPNHMMPTGKMRAGVDTLTAKLDELDVMKGLRPYDGTEGFWVAAVRQPMISDKTFNKVFHIRRSHSWAR
jgi:DNA-binding cell septation regulator SpoVG